MLKFKLFNGDDINDLEEYLKNYYAKNPDIIIYVGTDSAQHGRMTKYATIISFLHPRKGGHVIYTKSNSKREKDLFNRLWKEVEYTREVADYIHSTLDGIYIKTDDKKIPIIHLDFNKQSRYKSNVIHDISVGYLTGLGYKVETKDLAWAASVMADYFVKN